MILTSNKLAITLLLFLCLGNFSCSSPATEIKLVLDQYDQINKDYISSMKQVHKEKRLDSFQQDMSLLKDRCAKIGKMDLSKTPDDFQVSFKKVALFGCEVNRFEDTVTYQGDPKTKLFNEAERELETTSARYGYNYKHSTSPK